ncbi:MAG: EAL domain-containing protein [Terrimicrobiaceae bacterium]|nr:EAL domain-containing protein [Terrimicrobiaceae bacterium]
MSHRAAASAIEPLTALDVLIVEDDPVTRALLDRLVRKRGHLTAPCESAEIALARLLEQYYPIILLDVQLPGMSGLELCRQLRAQPDGDQYYILVGTGNDKPEDLRDILDAGASDYVAKPYHPGFLNVRLTIAEKQVKEIAARKRLEHELTFLATRDPLTKLLNRSQLEPALLAAIQATHEGRPAAVLYLDLDNFKVVNDTLGHDAGDRLLLALAALIKTTTRPQDELVRFGGDEFVVILIDAGIEQAMAVADRLREKLDEFRFLDSGMSFRVGASIGVAPVNALLTPAEVLVAADSACYAAKAHGRNRVELHRESDSEIAKLIADTNWATRIQEAMRDDSLELWFQPIVSAVDGTLLYQEALLRYMAPEQTIIVSPGAFLSSAQRSGQGEKLDRFVVHAAFKILADHPGLVLGVNLAAPSFNDSELIRHLESALSEYSVDPARLLFEITETEVMSNLDNAREVLGQMNAMGVKTALDDFGAGFSSLAYLKNLPIDFLKIDCAFIRDLTNNDFNQAILRAIREVARIRNIKTVAECVETREQYDLLGELGIDYAQGFFIARPRSQPYTAAEIVVPE